MSPDPVKVNGAGAPTTAPTSAPTVAPAAPPVAEQKDKPKDKPADIKADTSKPDASKIDINKIDSKKEAKGKSFTSHADSLIPRRLRPFKLITMLQKSWQAS